jgi:putative inorganic carbon (hco3(-)) transporter
LALQSKGKILWLIIGCILFIASNIFFVANDNYLFGLLPFGLAVLLFLFYSLDSVLLIIAFFTPLSIPLRLFFPTLGMDLNLPTEPLLIVATGVFIVKLLVEQRFDKKILSHPVTIAIFLYLTWMAFTSVTSTLPIVSFKFLATRIWFITSFYFLATALFSKSSNIPKYIWAYTISLSIVVMITLVKHSAFFFSHETCYLIMQPFFDDHTSYGAVLALVIPPLFGLLYMSRNNINYYILIMVLIGIILVGLFFSYTRAAWLGVCLAFGIWVLIKLKIKFRTLALVVITTSLIIIPLSNEIYIMLRSNKSDSSSNFSTQFQSMTNIKTDDSNVERLNRWSCAWRMFLDRPITGFGPGTYMFKYAPYQRSWERSLISTNAANLGNSHSEYMGPLAEQGFFGLLLFLAIIFTTIRTALKVINHSPNKKSKLIALCLILGLFTYYLHGFMNDFLDMDKVTALFWGFTAAIVCLDVYHFEASKEVELPIIQVNPQEE